MKGFGTVAQILARMACGGMPRLYIQKAPPGTGPRTAPKESGHDGTGSAATAPTAGRQLSGDQSQAVTGASDVAPGTHRSRHSCSTGPSHGGCCTCDGSRLVVAAAP